MSRFRPVDDTSRMLARQLLCEMRHATLATLSPDSGFPHLSRMACQPGEDSTPVSLLSDLARHTQALRQDARAGLLVEPVLPAEKGDPLTHPRLSLRVTAQPITRTQALRDRWLMVHPRAAVFIDLPDFQFWRMSVHDGLLNAGFGAATLLTAADMDLPPPE